jgi:NAD(P)-dependent dehydrogenase (short-subunit alcohol dehydrogenase family)
MAPFPSYTKEWHSTPYAAISPTRPELSLAGKSAVITGGATGIGLAISIALAEAGISKLAIIGRRSEVLSAGKTKIYSIVGNKTEVFTVSADISNQAEVDSAFSRIGAQFGQPLDLLVSNAGYFTGAKRLGTETEDEWTRAVNINIKGVYFTATAFITKAAPDATIINVSSAVAHLGVVFPGFSSYAATKMAGSKIMQYVQQENPGMHVVDMHPGQVRETEMAQKVNSRVQGAAGRDHIDDGEFYPLFFLGRG